MSRLMLVKRPLLPVGLLEADNRIAAAHAGSGNRGRIGLGHEIGALLNRPYHGQVLVPPASAGDKCAHTDTKCMQRV